MQKIIYQTALGHGSEIENEIRIMLQIYAPNAEIEFQKVPGLNRPTLVLQGLDVDSLEKLEKLTIYDIVKEV